MSNNFNEFMITDGDDEIELMLKSDHDSGVGVQRGGTPTTKFDPSAYYRHLTSEEDLLFVESWTVVIKGDCPDGFATVSRRLFSMLIKAWLYRGTQRYKDKGPVYIVQRVRMETNTRYARVHSSPILRMMQPLFNRPLEMAGLVADIGFPIARFAWETDAPGTIPSTKAYLDRTNGGADPATLVPIANHYDDHAVDAVQVYENGVGYVIKEQLADFETGDITEELTALSNTWDSEVNEIGDFDRITDVDGDMNDEAAAAHDGAIGIRLTFDDLNAAFGEMDAAAINQKKGTKVIWINTDELVIGTGQINLGNWIDGAAGGNWTLALVQIGEDFTVKLGADQDLAGNLYTASRTLDPGWNRILCMFEASSAPAADDGWHRMFVNNQNPASQTGVDNDTKDWDFFRVGMAWSNASDPGGYFDFDTIKIDTVGAVWADKLAAQSGEYGMVVPFHDNNAAFGALQGIGPFTAFTVEGDFDGDFLEHGADSYWLFYAVPCFGLYHALTGAGTWALFYWYYTDGDVFHTGAFSPGQSGYVKWRLEWEAASAPAADDGFIRLYIEDELITEDVGLDNDTYAVTELRMGATGSTDVGSYGYTNMDNIRYRGRLGTGLFPQPASVGDILYIGADEPFWNTTWNIITAADEVNAVYLFEYSDAGAGWPDLTLGDDLSLYPDDDPFDAVGISGAFFHPGDDWAPENVNGVTKYWIRISIVSFTTYTTSPVSGTYPIYNQRRPYALLNADELKGDVPPLIQLRMLGTAGGDGDVEMTNISRLLIGAKSRNLDEFDSHLNCGGDGMPPGWAVTYGADTSSVADPEVAGGDEADCSFAGDISNVMRIRYTGIAKAEAYRGKYRPFLKCQQIGGDPGDVTVNLRIRIDSTADYAPQIDTSPIILEAADDGHELVDLAPGNYMQIPFGDFYEADSLEGADLIIEVFAKVPAGPAATMEFYELILLPVDEWWGEYEDPITNSEFGTSALRGEKILIDDGGLVENRTGMFKIDGSEEWFIELWERHGKPPTFVPLYGDTYRLHFIFGYYNATWAVLPMLSLPGMGIMLEWVTRPRYLYLRGDD